MFEFVTQHAFWAAVVAYWIYSAAVSAMPEPAPSSQAYLWLYRFLHTIAGNLNTAFAAKLPGIKTLTMLLLIPLCLSATACTGYRVHPGALNATDSAAYDALLVAQAATDQGKADYQAGTLPAAAKEPLNKLVASYNITREAWLTYRGAISTNADPVVYADQLAHDLADLQAAITAFKGVK